MTKSKFFRVGTRPISALQFGERLKEELEQEQQRMLERIKDFYVQLLEQLLDQLRANSSERGQGFYAVRYNNPFEDADIITKRTRTGWQIRVDNDRFNMLDSGMPERQVTKTVKFPGYVGNLTNPYSDPIRNVVETITVPGSGMVLNPASLQVTGGALNINSPVKIVGRDIVEQLVGGRLVKDFPDDPEFTQLLRDTANNTIERTQWVTLKAGRTIAKVPARRFMATIKRIVDDYYVDSVTNRGSTSPFIPLIIKTSIERR